MNTPPKERYSDFSPQTVRRLWTIFIVILIGTVLAEFGVHPHASFGIDGTFGFHAWYGFLACVVIVLVSKLFGFLVKRREEYYAPTENGEKQDG